MGYSVVDEVKTFSFRDSYTVEAKISENSIVLQVEALIVKSNNSANSNYTNSYAGSTRIVFDDASIVKLIKLGYKRYDANDNLIEAIDDIEEPFAAIDMEKLLGKVFLTGIVKDKETENTYHVTIELPDEDPCAITEERDVVIKCSKVRISWDEYMNRVSDMEG